MRGFPSFILAMLRLRSEACVLPSARFHLPSPPSVSGWLWTGFGSVRFDIQTPPARALFCGKGGGDRSFVEISTPRPSGPQGEKRRGEYLDT